MSGKPDVLTNLVIDETSSITPNALRDYWDALDAYYRSIGMTDDDAYDDFRERNR